MEIIEQILNEAVFTKEELSKWKVKKDQGGGKKGKGGEPGDSGDKSDDKGKGSADEKPEEDPEDGEFGGTGEDIDRHHKNVEERFGGEGNQDAKPSKERDKGTGGSGLGSGMGGSGGGRGHGLDGNYNVDYSKIKPTFNWKTLVSRMIASVSEDVEETYQKPNKRNIVGAKVLQQTGKSAVKPGEVPSEAKLKLCIVVDSSGSMHSAATTIYANLEKLIKSHANLSQTLIMIKFSSNHYVYELNLKTRKYIRLMDVKGTKGKDNGSITELFSEFLGSSTNFTGAMTSEIKELLTKGYNVLVMTDTDILASGNLQEFMSMYKDHKGRVFAIFDTDKSFIAACQAFKEVPKNFTYFERGK